MSADPSWERAIVRAMVVKRRERGCRSGQLSCEDGGAGFGWLGAGLQTNHEGGASSSVHRLSVPRMGVLRSYEEEKRRAQER